MARLIGARWNAPVYRYIAAPNNTVTNIEAPDWQNDDDNAETNNHKNSRTLSCKYACHGIDMKYFFAEVEHFKQDEKFINNMRTVVFDFVKNDTISGWDTYVAPQFKTSIISSQIKYSDDYRSKQCHLWMTSFFLPTHAGMN